MEYESDRLDLDTALNEVPTFLSRGQFDDVIRVVDRFRDTVDSPREIHASWFVYRALAQDAGGDVEAAIQSYELALENDAEDPTALLNLATILACSPDDRCHNAGRAVELATRACSVVEANTWSAWHCLASTLARNGDFALAQLAIMRARKSVPREMEWRVERLAECIHQKRPFALTREELVSRLLRLDPSADAQIL